MLVSALCAFYVYSIWIRHWPMCSLFSHRSEGKLFVNRCQLMTVTPFTWCASRVTQTRGSLVFFSLHAGFPGLVSCVCEFKFLLMHPRYRRNLATIFEINWSYVAVSRNILSLTATSFISLSRSCCHSTYLIQLGAQQVTCQTYLQLIVPENLLRINRT